MKTPFPLPEILLALLLLSAGAVRAQEQAAPLFSNGAPSTDTLRQFLGVSEDAALKPRVAEVPPRWQPLRLETKDGWLLHGEYAQSDAGPSAPAVMLLAGLPTQRNEFAALREELLAAGISVLVLDVRGTGESLDRTLLDGTVETLKREDFGEAAPDHHGAMPLDVTAAVDYLRSGGRTAPSAPVVLVGLDQGSNVAAVALGKEATRVAAAVLVAPAFALQGLRAEDGVRSIQGRPILVIVADQDPSSMRRLQSFQQANPNVLHVLVPGRGHGGSLLAQASVREQIVEFARGLRKKAPSE